MHDAECGHIIVSGPAAEDCAPLLRLLRALGFDDGAPADASPRLAAATWPKPASIR